LAYLNKVGDFFANAGQHHRTLMSDENRLYEIPRDHPTYLNKVGDFFANAGQHHRTLMSDETLSDEIQKK
jgi:hypothetical protein